MVHEPTFKESPFSLPTTLSKLCLETFEHTGHTGLQANSAHQFLHSQCPQMVNISTYSGPPCKVVKGL